MSAPPARGRTAGSARPDDTSDAQPPFATFARTTIASYPDYGEAEGAVNWLAGQGFPVHHLVIVGTGLRSVERIADRMSPWRAMLIGAAAGMLSGVLLALVVGAIATELDSTAVLLYSLGIGTLFGAVSGALYHSAASAGRRDFVSVRSTEADRYDVQADEAVAVDAKRLLDAMPAELAS